MENKLKLSPPWAIYLHQLQAFFKKDPGVKIFYNERNGEITLYAKEEIKAEALKKLLPTEKNFGNVTIKVSVVSGGEMTGAHGTQHPLADAIDYALYGNEALSYIRVVEAPGEPFIYVVFKKEVVQYFNDDFTDLHGVCSTLYQTLADELFEKVPNNVFFCTDTEKDAEALDESNYVLFPALY